jgi:serine/threonine protein kinase
VHNEEQIVWHELVLNEYWEQLETEIDQRKQLGIVTKIEDIDIENIEMKKEHLTALVAISSTNSSRFLHFDNANLCEEGIISLAKLVDLSSKLQSFDLHHNRIEGLDSARCLSRSLKSHTRIEELHLHHCDLGSSPEILSALLQSDVGYITLDNNNIDSLGAVKIAEYLTGDPPIDALSLDNNRLNDDDAILISQALKRNTKLCNLWLHSNNITSIGVKVLLTRVFDSSSLNSISESNHTMKQLVAMKIFSEENNKKLQGFIDGMLQLDRTQKIMLALQNKDSLLKYLTNVPVELIPEILRFPQRVVNQPQHKHLNIVYSTMRWWNMPMLYLYHHNCSVKPDSKRKRDD